MTKQKYIKKNKGILYNNWKPIKDLKLTQSNTNNKNYYNYSENGEKSNSQKKRNYFLINNNNINFNSNKSLNKNELYRNNFELLKKYSEIINRKKRKNLETEDYLKLKNKSRNKEKCLFIYNKKNYTVNNSVERRKEKEYSPYISEFMNLHNSISNGDESLNFEKNGIGNIKTTKKNNKRIKSKSDQPFLNKKTENNLLKKTKNNIKEKKRNRVLNLKEKINNINNSHYNKNYICKTIKNIFTKDKKLYIHINYVFFIPSKIKYKSNFEANNKYLNISHNYEYSYTAKENSFNLNKNKISKKKLTSIKEEEEKSKCSISLSMILENSKIVDGYNSIIILLERMKKNYIIKMKKIFLSKMKSINLIKCLNKIFRIIIFKNIYLININEKKETKNNFPKDNDINGLFVEDDKID